MKSKLTKLLCLVLALTTLLTTGAMAANATSADGPLVRVNGEIVDFPDAKPFVDENSRTMIPVRFVTEALGATVTWDGPTQTARITKGTTTIDVKIGSQELKVISGGKATTVKMDTAAVISDSRTYVPIRFVAEAMGATVDYSGKHRTVGIYFDELNAEEIARLRAHAYTQPDYALGYEDAKARYNESTLKFLYGDRSGFDSFANAREHLYYTMARNNDYAFPALKKILKNSDTDTFFKLVVDEAIAEINYQSENMTVIFRADESCIYQSDSMDRTTATVRGIAEVMLNVSPLELEGSETAMLCELGFTQLYEGKTMRIDIDVHMNTQPDYNVNIHSIVPLSEGY